MFSIIVAADEKGGIGLNNNLPWRLKKDMEFFKKTTTETPDPKQRNVVIMGRKTWDSIPSKFKPLTNRINIVITRNKTFKIPADVLLASNLDDALDKANKLIEIHKVFIMGGGQIYNLAMNHPQCKEIFLTRVHEDFNCDTFIADPPDDFEMGSIKPQKEKNIRFSFEYFVRDYNNKQ